MSAPGGPASTGARGSRPPPDLRLAGPALAVWLTSMFLLGARPWVAYTAASAAGAAALCLLWTTARRGRPAWWVWPDRTAGRRSGRWATSRAWSARYGPVLARVRAAAPPGARRPIAGAVLAGIAAAAACTGFRLSAVEAGPVRAAARADAVVSVRAVVTADPRLGSGRSRFGRTVVIVRVRAEEVRVRGRTYGVRVPLIVLADRQWQGLTPSLPVRFTARLTMPRHGELVAAVGRVRGPPRVIGPPSRLQRVAGTIRARLRDAAGALPPSQRGVLPGLVLGDTTRLDPRLAEEFRTAGLSHVLVVSGANLALVVGAVLGVARSARLGRRAAAGLAGLAVLGFVVVARPEPSVLRATVMAMIGLLALVSGRERYGLPALCAAVLVLVPADPELARSYGFALSVLATAGLLVLAPRWRRRLGRWMPQPCADAVAVAAAAQLSVTPVLAMLAGEISLVAIPANLLAAPAVPPATLLGALTAVAAPVSMPLARLLVWPAGLAVGWITGVARAAATLPHAALPWPDGVLGGFLAAALVVTAIAVLRRPWTRRIAAGALAGALCVAAGAAALAPRWPPPRWLLVMCDVGQGDALVLAAGPGAAVAVDTGPDPGGVDRCLADLRVTAVPLLVLTHPHADHTGGLAGVPRGRSCGTVLVSPGTGTGTGTGTSPPVRQRGHASAGAPGCGPVRAAAVGQRWTVGTVSLTVLGPPAGTATVTSGDGGSAVNNVSVILLARWPGLDALLTGDAEEAEQQALLGSGPLPRADVLKVPHHGSARQDAGFLAATGARVSLISAGRDNGYGHPAPSLLRLLHRSGMRAYRTDRDGDIAIVRAEPGLSVVARGASAPAGSPETPPRPAAPVSAGVSPPWAPRRRRACRGRHGRR